MKYAVTIDFTATVGIEAESAEDAEAQALGMDVSEVAGHCAVRVAHVELENAEDGEVTP